MLHPYNPTYLQLACPNEFDAHLVNKKNLNAMKKTRASAGIRFKNPDPTWRSMLDPYNPTYVQLALTSEIDSHLVNKKNPTVMKKTEQKTEYYLR